MPSATKMARPSTLFSICKTCRHRLQSQRRGLTTTASLQAGPSDRTSDLIADLMGDRPNPSQASNTTKRSMTATERLAESSRRREAARKSAAAASQTVTPSAELTRIALNANAEAGTRPGGGTPKDEPYHLHVFAHKHNTHITFTEPSRNPILSFSCGNIGLRKAQRSSFDAAYQLATYTMKRMALISWRQGGKGMPATAPVRNLHQLNGRMDEGIEVIMRGFGPGREAFQKALLGSEGTTVRSKICKVTDATRLKFGGARSPAVRRLG